MSTKDKTLTKQQIKAILDNSVSEADAQIAVFEWADGYALAHPEIGLLFHVPNGGSRNRLEAANLKRQGVKAGVPDLVLPVARCGYHGLFIEMKVGKNKTSAEQNEWLDKLRKQGYYTTVCYGTNQAIDVLTDYIEENTY